MTFTTPDGVDLYYERRGPRTEDRGRVIVLLNGIMMTTASWSPVLASLDRDCLLHDFRGQLRSPASGPWNIEQHADDLAALFDQLGIDRADIVGTSYGGEVGMIFAYSYPERIESLTVIASTSRADDRMKARTSAAMNTALTEPDRLFDVVVHDFYSREFIRAHSDLIEAGRERLATYPKEFFVGYAALCDAFSALDITDNLSAIRCPTLVVAAENDALKPLECSETIANTIAGARLRVIAASGHAVVIERPDEVAQVIRDFISG